MVNKVKIVTHSGGTLDVNLEDGKLADFIGWLEREESSVFPISVTNTKTIYLTSVTVELFCVTKEEN
ncbi:MULTISPECIES: hypothetical protein [Bacillus]|uniref:hypothetical protein n=1 Tax=Bacillus TaxID=1386 RepID=UPI000279DBAE|nr:MULTISPECIES: hypothetical protein [Bacillus cereus group]EJR61549.1 hypothetical protein IIO_03002 [Bacillus cereus VD115]KAB0448946.1 hypothetical protein CH334_11200 [Lysinibacillus sp. VIA-II-2016]EJV46184.1 hypothetical protein IEA_03419 [Bacillus toyonensis]EJV93691.1 hypothetical protein IGI_03409 [Bacillus toyonensis]EOP43386.1 hypothetical protein IKI_01276 [Bacillus toyonensis]